MPAKINPNNLTRSRQATYTCIIKCPLSQLVKQINTKIHNIQQKHFHINSFQYHVTSQPNCYQLTFQISKQLQLSRNRKYITKLTQNFISHITNTVNKAMEHKANATVNNVQDPMWYNAQTHLWNVLVFQQIITRYYKNNQKLNEIIIEHYLTKSHGKTINPNLNILTICQQTQSQATTQIQNILSNLEHNKPKAPPKYPVINHIMTEMRMNLLSLEACAQNRQTINTIINKFNKP